MYPKIASNNKAVSKEDTKISDNDIIVWHDPREEPFGLVGFEWIEEDSVYRRLPVNPNWEIIEAVDRLSNKTAGGQVRFRTDSKVIFIKVVLEKKSSMSRMSASGQSAFDLYITENGIKRYLKTAGFSSDSVRYTSRLFSSDETKLRDFTLNFPLYNGVKSLYIGLEQDSKIDKPLLFSNVNKFVIYGTSITQGGYVSRPGMAYSNIISRKLDAQFVNLGFAGNGRGEPELAHLINEISDVGFIILDYEANANHTIQKNINPFIDILREKHSTTPILIMSKTRYTAAQEGSEMYKTLMSNRDFQKKMVEERKAKGDDNIYFIDGSEIYGNDYFECTVDGKHPNDLGAYKIADALIKAILTIVDKE
ncbi:MAG: SGNH/GDSL hydrolase family protein [Melioribacteraceae bacterium]|nr:SGNH/GDSL hydrolase family protein [Melioribacteraceae bacterium]